MTGKDFARPEVRAARAYEEEPPANGLNLANNTNLFGANPALAKALTHVRADSFWDYPSLDSAQLRRAIARKFGLDPAEIVVGNGSDDLTDLLIHAFIGAGEALAYTPPTFSMIPTWGRLAGVDLAPVPLSPNTFAMNADAVIDARAKVAILCRPNNPTGNSFPRKDVLRVVEESEGIVVVDEAYVEFAEGSSFIGEVARFPNLVVLRTFSKAHALAGLRVGYAVAQRDVAVELGKVRGPFRLNSMSELVASIAVEDDAFVERCVRECKLERPRLARLLAELGFRVFPSDANFLFTRPPVDARELAAALAQRGVFVRDFEGELAPYMRVSVGPPAVTARFIAALGEALAEVRRK
ncbi:MAG: histidinol-phosphate transaminase [Thermoplasmatota archaeon]